MSYGTNGSVIGPDNVPTTAAASGVWSLGEIAEARRDDIWPAPTFGWIAQYTIGSGTDYPRNVRVDSSNDIYFSGYMTDPSYYEPWVVKVDADGVYDAATAVLNPTLANANMKFHNMLLDSSGVPMIGGLFNNSSASPSDNFGLVKLPASPITQGTDQFHKYYRQGGHAVYENQYGLNHSLSREVFPNGNFGIAYHWWNGSQARHTINFGEGTNGGGEQNFRELYTEYGQDIWEMGVTGNDTETWCLWKTDNGTYYLGLSSRAGTDWIYYFAGAQFEQGNIIEADSTGSATHVLVFLRCSCGQAMLLKLKKSDGSIEWQRKIDAGGGSGSPNSVAGPVIDSSGNIYVSWGEYTSQGAEGSNFQTHWAKYDSSGTFQHARSLSNITNIGSSNDPWDIALDSTGDNIIGVSVAGSPGVAWVWKMPTDGSGVPSLDTTVNGVTWNWQTLTYTDAAGAISTSSHTTNNSSDTIQNGNMPWSMTWEDPSAQDTYNVGSI